MNMKTPLAAALLLTALTASAQLTLTQPQFSLTTTSQEPPAGTLDLSKYNAPGTKIPSDQAFNCSTYSNLHIPYKFCTPEEETERLSFLGFCPWNNKPCKDYMERIMLPKGDSPAEVLGAKDSGPAAACQVPPCLAEPPAAAPIAASARTPQSGDSDFIGPPVPPGFYDEQDKKELAKARTEIGDNGVKDVIDLGNGAIAKMRDDGTVQMCGRGSGCAKPVPADSVDNPKIAEWVVENKGYAGVNNNPNGGGMKSMSNPPSGRGAQSTEGAPQDPGSGGSAGGQEDTQSAFDKGAGMGRDLVALGGGGGSSGSGSSPMSDVPGAEAGAAAKPIAVSQAEVEAQVAKGYSYIAVKEAAANSDAIIKGGAKALETNVEANDAGLEYRGTQSEANGR